jgi:hypothetical protein
MKVYGRPPALTDSWTAFFASKRTHEPGPAAAGSRPKRGELRVRHPLGDEDRGENDAGVACLKVERRKKKPEYVATVTHQRGAASKGHEQPLVGIKSDRVGQFDAS